MPRILGPKEISEEREAADGRVMSTASPLTEHKPPGGLIATGGILGRGGDGEACGRRKVAVCSHTARTCARKCDTLGRRWADST
jgi:hypothetical protein